MPDAAPAPAGRALVRMRHIARTWGDSGAAYPEGLDGGRGCGGAAPAEPAASGAQQGSDEETAWDEADADDGLVAPPRAAEADPPGDEGDEDGKLVGEPTPRPAGGKRAREAGCNSRARHRARPAPSAAPAASAEAHSARASPAPAAAPRHQHQQKLPASLHVEGQPSMTALAPPADLAALQALFRAAAPPDWRAMGAALAALGKAAPASAAAAFMMAITSRCSTDWPPPLR